MGNIGYIFGILGMSFGIIGFVFGIFSMTKVNKLEKQFKELNTSNK